MEVIYMEEAKEVRYIIYLLTNKENGKMYAGMTSCEDPNDRWQNGKGYKNCPYIRNAINKYGWDGFTHEVIYSQIKTKEEAEAIEIKMIADLNLTNREFGYNISHGGNTPMKGRKHTEKTKRKLSIINKGKKGKKWTEEQREYMSNYWKGCISPKRKKVICINNGIIYNSITEASELTNAHDSNICNCCAYKSVSAGTCAKTGDALIWRYLSDYKENGYIEYSPQHKGFRKVVCLNTGEVFEKIADAAEKYGFSRSGIGGVCDGDRRYCGTHPINNEKMCWMDYEDYKNSTPQDISNKLKIANTEPKRGRMVICTTTGELFANMTRASEKYGICGSHITSVCQGGRGYCGIHPTTEKELKWMYYEDYLKSKDKESVIV